TVLVSWGKLRDPPFRARRSAADTVVVPLAVRVAPAPEASSAPPVMDKGPARVLAPVVTVTEPPVMDSVALVEVVIPWTWILSPEWMVMVAEEPGLITALSPEPGTLPVLQFEALSQLPLPGLVHVTVLGRARISSCSRERGRRLRCQVERLRPRGEED